MTDDDSKLVQRFLDGERGAFEPLVDRYQKTVYNIALRMVNDPDDAQDITQNVFIRASEKLSTFNPKYRFFSWIYRITVNESINFLETRKRNETLSDQIAAPGKGPEELLQDSMLSDSIEDGLMKLSDENRTVIILRHFEGLSYEEIGSIIGLPSRTVKSRLFSARQSLKKILSVRKVS